MIRTGDFTNVRTRKNVLQNDRWNFLVLWLHLMAANFLFCWLNHSLKLLFSFFFHTQNLKFHNGTAIVVPISMTDTLNGSYYYYDSYHLYGRYSIW